MPTPPQAWAALAHLPVCLNSLLPRQLATSYPCVCPYICAVHSRLVQRQPEEVSRQRRRRCWRYFFLEAGNRIYSAIEESGVMVLLQVICMQSLCQGQTLHSNLWTTVCSCVSTEHCRRRKVRCCDTFEGGKNNPLLRGVWSDAGFSMACKPGAVVNRFHLPLQDQDVLPKCVCVRRLRVHSHIVQVQPEVLAVPYNGCCTGQRCPACIYGSPGTLK
jgi:hypothetical protein